MNISNLYSSNLFSSLNRTTSTDYSSFFASINNYKTASKYAIATKYGKYAHTANSTAKTDNTSTEAVSNAEGAKFLTQYKDTYDALKTATSDLKSTLTSETATAKDKAKAAKQYADAYNDTMAFLTDNATDTTGTMNMLKSSLDNIGSISSSSLASIGITKGSNGTFDVDQDALISALENNPSNAEHKLSSLTSLSNIHTNMASNVSNASLLKEQKLLSAFADPTALNTNSFSYSTFAKLAKNPTAMNNFYFQMMYSGMFMDISI